MQVESPEDVGVAWIELFRDPQRMKEMGATARDLAESVHPHPTLSETLMEAAEVFFGHSSHTFVRKKAENQK